MNINSYDNQVKKLNTIATEIKTDFPKFNQLETSKKIRKNKKKK